MTQRLPLASGPDARPNAPPAGSREHRALAAGLGAQPESTEHPAALAWQELGPRRSRPHGIEVLKRKKKSSVYRLIGAGPGDSSIIAKRCRRAKAHVERFVYEEVLPGLPAGSPGYLGSLDETDRGAEAPFSWLFFEDVGNQRYSPHQPEQRRLVAAWLGRFHAAAAELERAGPLPDRTPPHYREYLRMSLERLPGLQARASLPSADLAVLDSIVSLCERAEAHWGALERFCEGMPRTLVHGDFLAKNVHVRGAPGALGIVPLDWGNAGFGLAGADLGQSALPRRGVTPDPADVSSYLSSVRDRWPWLTTHDVRQLANLGQMFWALTVIARGAPEFDTPWARFEKILTNYRIYEAVLRSSIGSAAWAE
jgi:hypothetical protein